MFGVPLGPLGMATMGDGRPDNSQADGDALQKLYEAVRAANATPNGKVARGFAQFGMPTPASVAPPRPSVPALGGLGLFPAAPHMNATPMQTAMATPAPLPDPSAPVMAKDDTPAPRPHGPYGPMSVGGAPLPDVGPSSVGGAPLSGTPAQWNTVGGQPSAAQPSPLDTAQWPSGPIGAPQAASGPDVIQKLMSFFGNKDNPDT